MFELLNVKWGEPTFGTPSGTVTWSSELGGNLVLNNGATDASIEQTLNIALQTWENVAAIDFVEDNVDPMFTIRAAPIDIDFAGVTVFRPDLAGLNTLESAEVIFNSQYLWSDNGGPGSTDFFAVALHELGHIMGLDHPDDPSQIMNAVIQVDELGLGDIAGAQFIYGTDGDDVPVEIPETGGDSGGGGGGGGGLLIGLLALIAAFFTGGGALVAMAAGRIAGMQIGDTEEGSPTDGMSTDPSEGAMAALDEGLAPGHFHGDGHDHGPGDYHGVQIAEFALLPTIDFTLLPNPCGCVGLCEHIIETDDCSEDFFL